MSPDSSVRTIREPPRASSSSVEGFGCPNLLPSPTLIRVYSGLSVASTRSLTAPELPWCPILRTSTSPSAPWSTSGCSTSFSASPVRTAENPSASASSTTLDSLAEASATAAGGDSTVSAIDPADSASPAASSRTPPGPQSARAASRIRDSSATAPAGSPTKPTVTSPSSAERPPAWSACK